MPTHREIYLEHAAEYEELVSREDYQGSILRALQRVVPLSKLDVVDLGAGTGRLACLLAPYVKSVIALDASVPMLRVAANKLRASGLDRWMAAAAEHRALPLVSASADLIVSGWSASYVAVWNPENWREAAEQWLTESQRVLRRDGTIILFESLGTGKESPVRLPHLANFYAWLDERGFASDWIRTDYRFESAEIADQLTSFFFGDEMKQFISPGPLPTLPECTGVWWKQIQAA